MSSSSSNMFPSDMYSILNVLSSISFNKLLSLFMLTIVSARFSSKSGLSSRTTSLLKLTLDVTQICPIYLEIENCLH